MCFGVGLFIFFGEGSQCLRRNRQVKARGGNARRNRILHSRWVRGEQGNATQGKGSKVRLRTEVVGALVLLSLSFPADQTQPMLDRKRVKEQIVTVRVQLPTC